MTPSTQVSVVIPNYNGQHLLAKHLPAVLRMLRAGDELVIVDDASSDDSVALLQRELNLVTMKSLLPQTMLWQGEWITGTKSGPVQVLKNLVNRRFGESCNRGFTLARHPLVFLLNSDVSPEPSILKYLLPHFANDRVFGVGCLEKEPLEGGGEQLGGKNVLWFERGLFVHARAENFESGETAWIAGGSGMFRRSKWLELGGFDLSFKPAYWEDIDLSFRARQRGWLVLFEPQAVVHHMHESTNSSAFGQQKMQVMSVKNAVNFLWRRGTWSQRLSHLVWLPYHFLITNAKMNGAFVKGYRQFIGSLL